MKNNTIYTKKSNLDQFYTSEKIAKDCYSKVLEIYGSRRFKYFLEPSAGSGAFYNLFPYSKKIGIDLEPKCDGVKKQDFFEFIFSEKGKVATIGNPPFGKNSSLAVRFFNKAAEFSDIIAFIIPKTFRKKSLQNRLDLNFRLKLDKDLPKNSFVLNGEPYDVPCCFQIWERSKFKRKITKINLDNNLFDFVKKNVADLAVRRVGGRTGKANEEVQSSSETTHYFLKVKDSISPKLLLKIINSINFTKIINSTAGIKSLSKPEFVLTLLKSYKNNL
jgi:hypothetical protein